jgi:hypothetical protein
VLSISLFFKLACDRMLFLFAGKETDERASRRTHKAWMLLFTTTSFTTLIVLLYNSKATNCERLAC